MKRSKQFHEIDALVSAADTGDTARVLHFLDAGTPIDGRDEQGWNALGSAARNGHADVVRLLLERGASLSETLIAGDDETLLHTAAKGARCRVRTAFA